VRSTVASEAKRLAAASGGTAGSAPPPPRDGWIGALGSDERITRALSRARQGLYLIANAEAIGSAECAAWDAVFAMLKACDAAGQFLSLLATRTSTGKRALVRSGDDFAGVVGEHEAKHA